MGVWLGDIWISGGSGGSGPDNFSYEEISTTITIPVYQQMILHGILKIESGDLVIEGSIVIEV